MAEDSSAGEELDYRITFPTPVAKDFTDEEGEELRQDTAQQSEPVVILLGWLGCQEKHLAKYAAIWDKKGCITIQYNNPSEQLSFQPTLLPTATKILELITDLNLEDSPILFHVFSNWGSLLYKSIIEVLHSDQQFGNLCIAGTILDSAPAQVTLNIGMKAVMALPNTNIFVRYLLSAGFLLRSVLQWTYSMIAPIWGGKYEAPDVSVWEGVKNDPSRWPQMYLYSRGDEIIPYEHVREVIRCHTIQYVAPSDIVFHKTHMLRPIAEKLLDVLIKHELEDYPVLFHVFSNGGGVVYRYASELVRTQKKFSHINVIGSIFDSCPAPRSIVTGLKAYFTNFHPKNKFLKCLMMFLCITFMMASRTWRDIARLFAIDTEAAKQRYWEAMSNDPNRWPQLYLFSVNDRIVHFSDVKKMITIRKTKGVDVYFKMWERSPHVAHLRFHKEEYIEACQNFSAICQRKQL